MGFSDGVEGKEPTCNAGDLGLIPGLGGSPGGGHGNPLQYSCLENPNGQRSLVGYSPWGCKESDTTEQLSVELYTSAICHSCFSINFCKRHSSFKQCSKHIFPDIWCLPLPLFPPLPFALGVPHSPRSPNCCTFSITS